MDTGNSGGSSKSNALFKWYADLPPWARATMIIGGSVVVIYAVYEIIQSYKASQAYAKSQQEVNQYVADLNALNATGVVASFQQSQYQQWADSIAAQFSGCDPTSILNMAGGLLGMSNSGAVVNNIAIQLINNADFLALQAAFGIRTISKSWVCGGNYTNVTLTAAVTDQLSVDEINTINANMTAAAAKAGGSITYSF